MEIFPDVGRIVCSTVIDIDPIRNVPIAMSYRESGTGKIETRLRPGGQWDEHTYRIEGDVAIWSHSGSRDWPWVAIPCDQLPSWFAELKRRALIRMDERDERSTPDNDPRQNAP